MARKDLKLKIGKVGRKSPKQSLDSQDGASSSCSEHSADSTHPEDTLDDKLAAADLGSAMSKILKTSIPAGMQDPPVLVKRKAVERQLEEERLEKRARTLVRQELRQKRDSAHKLPDMESANFEKGLKKFATKGVVHLFNAVHQYQAAKERTAKATQEAKQKAKPGSQAPVAPPKDVKAISKASFLELLKMGGGSKAKKP